MAESKLNAAQKSAVEYTTGPLLIVAGAGTGKTTVITKKIAYLLENKLAKPEEILALTFNDKAAEEIQDRVDDQLSIGYTDIQISTFHSFCQRLLEKHAIDIGLSNQFKLLTQTASWLFVRKNFAKFNLDYYRPRGNPFRHIYELLQHFSKCKDELISPEIYLAHAEGLAKSKGDMVIEEKNRLTEVANAYHTYNQLLRDNALMDFGDLMYYANELLSSREKIRLELQKRYKFILVDEFQDVNWAQYALLQLLTGPPSVILSEAKDPSPKKQRDSSATPQNDNEPQPPQLTVVGDDDQSIYAFRGASVSNILHFKDDFPNAKEIVLSENFRSVQPILDTAYKSIQNNNPDRLEVKLNIDKQLHSNKVSTVILSKPKDPLKRKKRDSSAAPQNDNAVVHMHHATLDAEARAVVDEILRLKKTDESAVWDDFAILVRANGHADPFLYELENAQIPYEFLASAGLFRQPVILDCINYLSVVDSYLNDAALFRLLNLPFLVVKENDIQKITHGAKKKSISYYETFKRAAEFAVSDDGKKTCDKIISVVHEGMQRARTEKPSVVLYNFLEKSDYLEYLTREEEQGNRAVIRSIYHLKQFFDYLFEYETVTADPKLATFLEHFTMITEAGDRGALYQPNDTPDSVNILTVHASKGLEFKYVFVVNLVEDRFPSRSRGDGIELPVELIKEKLPEGDSHFQEERRLFYVAVTRAKERLYFTSADDYGGARAKKISRFLNELGYVAAGEKKVTKLLPKRAEAPKEGKGEFVYELPKVFSFSQVKAYETCPYQYKLAHILKIPTKGSASFSFGQTIHGTLQKFYGRIQELNSATQKSLFGEPKSNHVTSNIKVPSLDELLAMYEGTWIPDWYKSQNQREEYFQTGKEILRTFYKAEDGHWTIPAALESWFKIKVGDYFLHGRIDRVDGDKKELEIIDYKTGKGKETLTSEDKEQLLIYQIAVEELPEYQQMGVPKKLTYHYVNDNLKTSFIGKPEDLEKLKLKLKDTIDKIHAKGFTATPSKFACDFCDFKSICEYSI